MANLEIDSNGLNVLSGSLRQGGVGVQPLNSNLSAISGLTAAADQFIYFTSASVAALAPVTALGRSVLAASTQGAAQNTLGLGTLSLQNSGAVSITGGAIAGLSSLDVNGDVNFTANGNVTLRGPVKTEEEKAAVASKAQQIAGADKVDNQIEVKGQ